METDKSIERTAMDTRAGNEATHQSIPSAAPRYPVSSHTIVPGPRFWAPVKGSAYAYKTIRCPLERDDVAASRAAIEELFRQYGLAVGEYLHLVSLWGTDRAAMGPSAHEAVRALTPGLYAHIRYAALDKAIESWRSREALERTGRIPERPVLLLDEHDLSGHQDAIRLDMRTYRLVPERPVRAGNATIRPLWASIPTPTGRVALRIGDDGYQVPIILNIIDGRDRAAIRSAELVRRGCGPDQELSLDIRLSRPIPEEHRSIEGFVSFLAAHPDIKVIPTGVDIGIVNTAVAVAPGKGRTGVRFFKGRAERARKRRMADLIRRLMVRGTRKATFDAQMSREKEKRRNRAYLHEVSRGIVELAMSVVDRSKGEVPVIVLEDLRFEDIARRPARGREDRGGEEGNARGSSVPLRRDVASELRSWAYGQLRDLIAAKAAWEGIPTVLVPPCGSSTECPRCRRGDVVRRRDVHRLVCPDCAYKADDDYCAALNIARRGLARLLKDRDQTRPVRYHDHELRGVMRPAEGGAADAPRGPEWERCGASTRA